MQLWRMWVKSMENTGLVRVGFSEEEEELDGALRQEDLEFSFIKPLKLMEDCFFPKDC